MPSNIRGCQSGLRGLLDREIIEGYLQRSNEGIKQGKNGKNMENKTKQMEKKQLPERIGKVQRRAGNPFNKIKQMHDAYTHACNTQTGTR